MENTGRTKGLVGVQKQRTGCTRNPHQPGNLDSKMKISLQSYAYRLPRTLVSRTREVGREHVKQDRF